MKKISTIMAVISSALLFSCTKNEISEQATGSNKEDGFKYVFIIDGENDGKTTLDGTTITWEVNDKIGIFANGSTNTYGKITTTSPSVQFPIYLSQKLNIKEKIYCYYPWSSENNSATSSTISMSIPESQSGDSDAMPQVAIPYTVTEAMAQGTTNVGNIKFCNLGSVARFHVYSSNEEYRSETVQSICFTANAAIAGTFTFNAENVDYSNKTTLEISGYDKTSVTISTSASVPESKDDAEDIDMILAPGSYSGTVVVKTDQATYTYTLSSAKTFARSAIKPLSVDLNKGTRAATANCSWDLSTNDYDSATEELVTWSSDAATMTNAKGEGTKANNYLGGGTNTHTRMYAKNIFTITPKSGYKITSAEFTSTAESYAAKIKSSTWTNASAAVSGTTTTITPTDGTKLFSTTLSDQWRVTGVTLYYTIVATKQLSSIALSGDYKTSFKTTDEFSFGGTVTATFDDETQEDVTSGTEFSGYDLSTPGNQTVTASYTYAGVTKTTDYSITVTGSPSISAEDITDVPAAGVVNEETSYTAQFFTDDVEVTEVTGCVTEAIADQGTIVYTVAPNYTLNEKTGTIVLQSAGDNTVTKTINVTQESSKLTVSTTEVVIPYDSYEATFTVTTAEMGWNTAVTLESGMNITLNPESGDADESARTVTVSTTIEASESGVQTLGTISVYRNGNTSDSQKKTITVKRAQKPSSTTKYYVKATTISAGTYLFVRDGKTVSGYASNALTLGANVTFTNEKIASDATVDGYAITITEVATGKYSIKQGTTYIGYNSKTNFKTTTTAPTSTDNAFLWTVSVLSDGTFKFANVGTTTRIIAANNKTSATQLKPYASSNVPGTNPCPYLYKKEN